MDVELSSQCRMPCFLWLAKRRCPAGFHGRVPVSLEAHIERQSTDSTFFREDTELPSGSKDAFSIYDALLIVSPALRDILVQFNIGDTQLIEEPIYEDEAGTPSGLPNHYVLNVHQPRETLIPELSENIEQSTPEGQSAQVTTYSGF